MTVGILVIALAALLLLLFLGLPIFVAFLVLNVGAVFYFFGTAGFGLFANSIYTSATTAALATVPLVLPPTVLGFYLLTAFGARSPLGAAVAAGEFDFVHEVAHPLPVDLDASLLDEGLARTAAADACRREDLLEPGLGHASAGASSPSILRAPMSFRTLSASSTEM